MSAQDFLQNAPVNAIVHWKGQTNCGAGLVLKLNGERADISRSPNAGRGETSWRVPYSLITSVMSPEGQVLWKKEEQKLTEGKKAFSISMLKKGCKIFWAGKQTTCPTGGATITRKNTHTVSAQSDFNSFRIPYSMVDKVVSPTGVVIWER